MGFKSPWFLLLVLCLCVSTVANSKPLSNNKLTSEDCAESCTTGKEKIVHKIEPRDVKDHDYTFEYQRTSDTNHEELLNIDSVSDFDIEETDDEDDEPPDELNSSGDDVSDLGGKRLDDTVEGDGINLEIDRRLPEMIIHDTVDGISDDSPVVKDDADTPGDDDDTFAADDATSGGHEDYADDLFDETQDNHDNDESHDDHVNNSPDDNDDTFGDDDDADDYDSNTEDMRDDDDDTHDINHVINLPDDDDDPYDEVVNLDHVPNTPNDDDDTFGVDDDVDDSIELPDLTTDDDDVQAEGPGHVLEEHHHKSAKVTRHHSVNPLNKHPDSKLGRLLKKHHSTDKTSDKSRENLHEDIYDDEYYDFESHKRKHKIPTFKGRRTLSLDKNSDFDHEEKLDISIKNVQENDEKYVEGSADDFDKQTSLGDVVKQADSVAETTAGEKDPSVVIQEDPIEGEEEEESQSPNASSFDDEGIEAAYSTSENLTEENHQHYKEDKVEGEEEEEEVNEVKVGDGSVLNSERKASITNEELLTDYGDLDEMVLGA